MAKVSCIIRQGGSRIAVMMGLCASLLITAPSKAQTAANQANAFDNFATLRHSVLEAISGAKQRIWLVTGYLTDGEIVSALYVAQYRKLDVTVLLGREKANHYMSRLNYLKSQNIPVFIKPGPFKSADVTGLLVDNKLLSIDGELDFLAKYKRYQMTVSEGAAAEAFIYEFSQASKQQLPAIPRPVPLVGRPQHPGASGKGSAYKPPKNDGSYRYNSGRTTRPEGVPGRLPKATILEERARQNSIQNSPQPATGTAASSSDGGSL